MKPDILHVHRDARGSVFEPAGEADLPAQKNVHVVVTHPGGVRGNHAHRRGTEIIVVAGPALVRYREEGRVVDHRIPDGEVHRFRVPPGVAHAIRNTGTTDTILVAFSTEPYDPADPDTVRDELIS